MRAALKADIVCKRKRAAQDIVLVSGDRMLAKNSQYTSKTGGGRFMCREGKVRDFRVVENNGGIVKLSAMDTGDIILRPQMQAIQAALSCVRRKGRKQSNLPLTRSSCRKQCAKPLKPAGY